MIRKLRRKFIAISMFSLLAVLLLILGTVHIINYHSVIAEADDTLSLLAAGGGSFPRMEAPEEDEIGKEEGMNGETGEEMEDPAGEKPREQPGEIPGHMSPELPYESRYFSVILKENGEAASVDTGKVAAIDSSTAVQYAYEVWQTGRDHGFIKSYRYVAQETENGRQIIFLDCRRNLSTFYSFLWSSMVISALGLAAVFILLLVLSRRIVAPVSDSYEKQKRFITDAGHEIKTPLTIVDADAEILEMELGDNEWLRDIRTQTRRLKELTDDLIYLSRMEEGQTHMTMMEFPLSDMVSELAQSFQAPARTQGKEIRCEIEPMISWKGDEKALGQLTSILLDNAVKYSSPGSVVEVKLFRQRKHVVWTVSNQTEGIDPEQLHHMFDRFYRGEASRNAATGGHGIGLSVARAVAEAHRGKISAASEDGRKLTVTVTLPG